MLPYITKRHLSMTKKRNLETHCSSYDELPRRDGVGRRHNNNTLHYLEGAPAQHSNPWAKKKQPLFSVWFLFLSLMSQIHPCCFLLWCWEVVHCMAVTQHNYPFVYWWILGCFKHMAIVNKAVFWKCKFSFVSGK